MVVTARPLSSLREDEGLREAAERLVGSERRPSDQATKLLLDEVATDQENAKLLLGQMENTTRMLNNVCRPDNGEKVSELELLARLSQRGAPIPSSAIIYGAKPLRNQVRIILT